MNPRLPAFAALLALVAASPAAYAATPTTPAPAATKPATPAAPELDYAAIGSALTTALGGFLDQSKTADTGDFALPSNLAKIQSAAKVAGQSALVDQLAAKLNLAGDQSQSGAADLVKTALTGINWADAKATLGNPDGATRFLQKTAGKQLREQLLPIVKKSVAAAGVPDQYKQLLSAAGPAASLFGKPGITDLESYVTDQTLDQIFKYMGKQEAALRANPALAENPTVKAAFALLGTGGK